MRDTLAETRSSLLEGSSVALEPAALAARALARARQLASPAPRPVLNATGVVLHTNLGRSPLSPAALAAVSEIAAGYSDLELDLETGERGSRQTRVARLLRILSGAEAALVVNNNAGGLLLAVEALAAGREVVLSRGELVEIGGSFRVPEILQSSRARLREVGTTNRTHLRDYADAICDETGLLLKVHRSNFRVEGFTAEVTLSELAALGKARGVPVVEDRGSGTFADVRDVLAEPDAASGLRDGADLVLFSGDKLLGGPQAGIAVGRRDLIERMRQSPLARALRVDKLTLAALDWTLRALLEGRERDIPVLAMLLASPEELEKRAERLAAAIRERVSCPVAVEPGSARVGGGALPETQLAGPVVRVTPSGSAAALARGLRGADPPVLVRVQRDTVLLDPRTLSDADVDAVARAFAAPAAQGAV